MIKEDGIRIVNKNHERILRKEEYYKNLKRKMLIDFFVDLFCAIGIVAFVYMLGILLVVLGGN